MKYSLDWGNSNTVISCRRVLSGKRTVDLLSSPLIPSYLEYDNDGEVISFGSEAKQRRNDGHTNVVTGIKNLIGVSFSHPLRSTVKRKFGYDIHPHDGGIVLKMGSWVKSPEEIAVDFFLQLKEFINQEARNSGGFFSKLLENHDMDQCVVTCPAIYNESQIRALEQCLLDAGYSLDSKRLVPEPLAAEACIPKKVRKSGPKLIVDWGGGTLDFALIDEQAKPQFLSSVPSGCGGIDMDNAIRQGLEASRLLPSLRNEEDWARANGLIEEIKETMLGSDPPATLCKVLSLGDGTAHEFEVQREALLQWVQPIIDKAIKSTKNVSFECEFGTKGGHCIFIGGPFLSPHLIQEFQKNRVEGDILRRKDVTVATAVSVGALEFAGSLPLSRDYGILVELVGFKMGPLLLQAQSPCPAKGPWKDIRWNAGMTRMARLAVWARKSDPSTETLHYEQTASYTLMPRIVNGEAVLRARLLADASGKISAEIIDQNLGQKLILPAADSMVTKPLERPPYRDITEVEGENLVRAWKKFNKQENSSASDSPPPFDEVFRGFYSGEPDQDSKIELLRDLAIEAQVMAYGTDFNMFENPPAELSNLATSLEDLYTDAGFSKAVDNLQILHMELIRIWGRIKVKPDLIDLEICRSGKCQEDCNILFGIFDELTESKFSNLMLYWARIKSALNQENQFSLDGLFNEIEKILYWHGQAEKLRPPSLRKRRAQ